MIVVSKDITPDRQIYYLGSVVIRILEEAGEAADSQDKLTQFSQETGCGLEMFALALDWLFLLGAVDAEGRLTIDVS